jgi:hypothetical protein
MIASPSMEHSRLMRRILTFSVLFIAAGVVTACRPDEIITTENIPTAGVRFIHAVPDIDSTMTSPLQPSAAINGRLDFRFVDLPENNVQWEIEFRNTPRLSVAGANGIPGATFVSYFGARAGGGSCASSTSCQRQFKIFLNGTTAAVASTVVKDTTVTLEAGKNYTALLWGYANPGGTGRPANAATLPLELRFIEEAVADPGANVAIRVINASNVTIDARYYPSAGAAPGTDIMLNMAPRAISGYVTPAPGLYRLNVDLAGTATNVFANNIDRIALDGTAAITVAPGPIDAIPGTNVAGSAVTAIIFPASVAGTRVPQGAGSATIPPWNDEAIVFVWDRRPPRPAGI